MIYSRKITLALKLNPTMFQVVNQKSIGAFNTIFGPSIKAVLTLSSKTAEMASILVREYRRVSCSRLVDCYLLLGDRFRYDYRGKEGDQDFGGRVGPIETRAGILCRDFRSFDIDGNSRTGDSREYDSHDYRLYYRGWNHERGCFCSMGYCHEYCGRLDFYDSSNHRDVRSCLLGDGVVPDLAGVGL